ncbi:MAG: DUF58 domain-containing protein [Defluviitaleaceae bacterium]|nr:DUF58 domain-containing protein [Defluviitaleaceae bacterium]
MFKNRLAYVIVVVVLFQLVYIYENDMTYVAFYAVLMLPVMSLISALVLRGRFAVTEALSAAEVAKGDSLEYIFTLTNNSFLLCTNVHVSLEADSTALVADATEKYFSIPPYKSHSLKFNVGTKYRGVYSVGIREITLYDFLGIFKFKQKHGGRIEFTVNPTVLSIPSLPISSAEQDAADAHNFLQDENYSIISDLRKYQPSDGYKKIHWKLSAKKGELISKNFQATQKTCIALVIDNSYIAVGSKESALALEDSMVEALVSVMAYCSGQGFPVKLYCMGNEPGEASTGSFEYLYTVAADLRFGKFGRFDDYFANHVRMQTEAASMVLFLQEITEDAAAAIKTTLLFGNNVIVFAFSNSSATQRGLTQLGELGVHCIRYEELLHELNQAEAI